MSRMSRLLGGVLLAWTATGVVLPDGCPVFFETERKCDPITPASFLPASVNSASKARSIRIAENKNSVFSDFLDALNVTQSEFFAPWLGTWPDAIDWTAAVLGTHISAAIRSISEDLTLLSSREDGATDWRRASNLIDNYFTQIVAYHFGQDDLALRNEAYDDMLWVVLGWLETIQFVDTHSSLHYASSSSSSFSSGGGRGTGIPDQPYHGNVWVPAFAHRARVFWDVASHGWDTTLCGGGMIWNPRLLPYKNAITNELFVAASISMYLNFPGDNNQSPFGRYDDDDDGGGGGGGGDAKYLKAAVDGYRWLRGANMTNDKGLVVDGFHISGYGDNDDDNSGNNTRCDARDESVYTYNQGVVLSGQRGLWDATGAPSYLADGHRLVQAVMRATGYDLATDGPFDDPSQVVRAMRGRTGRGGEEEGEEGEEGEGVGGREHDTTRSPLLPRWHGLGRLGVMEDPGDAAGAANQDAQTFKGIFFHHLTAFCAPLKPPPPPPPPPSSSSSLLSPEEEKQEKGITTTHRRDRHGGLRFDARAFASVARAHTRACRAYGGWLAHNARAAMGTRDASGRFGQWWTAGLLQASGWTGPWPVPGDDGVRNGDGDGDGVGRRVRKKPRPTDVMRGNGGGSSPSSSSPSLLLPPSHGKPTRQQQLSRGDRYARASQVPLGGGSGQQQYHHHHQQEQEQEKKGRKKDPKDPNDRGRGRTVETQSGGLALLRAYWKIVGAS